MEVERALCRIDRGVAYVTANKPVEALEQEKQAFLLLVDLPDVRAEAFRLQAAANMTGALRSMIQLNLPQQVLDDACRSLMVLPGDEGAVVRSSVPISLALEHNFGRTPKETEAVYAKYAEASVSTASADRVALWSQAVETLSGCPSNSVLMGVVLLRKGRALFDANREVESVQSYKEALKVLSTVKGAEAMQGMLLLLIAQSVNDFVGPEQAITQLESGITLLRSSGGTELEAQCRTELACWRLALGQLKDGVAEIERALSLIRGEDTRTWQAQCHSRFSDACNLHGYTEDAVRHARAALTCYGTEPGLGDKRAHCHAVLAAALRSLGNAEEASEHGRKAIALRRLSIDLGTQGHAALDFAELLWTEGDIAGSSAEAGKALVSFRCAHDPAFEASALRSLAFYSKLSGDYQDSVVKCLSALRLLQQPEASNERDLRSCWVGLGDAKLNLNRFAEAAAAYRRAGNDMLALRGLAVACERLGGVSNSVEATRSLLSAARMGETNRGKVFATQSRRSVFEVAAVIHDDLAALLAARGLRGETCDDSDVLRWCLDPLAPSALVEAAFHYADCGKARVLNDLLCDIRMPQATEPTLRLLAARADTLREMNRLAARRQRASGLGQQQVQQLDRMIAECQSRHQEIESTLKRSALGAYVQPEYRRPLDVAKDLEPTTAVLQYVVSGDSAWLLLLTSRGVNALPLGVGTRTLGGASEDAECSLEDVYNAWQTGRTNVGLSGLVALARARSVDLARPELSRSNLINEAEEQKILLHLGNLLLPNAAWGELRRCGINSLIVIPGGALHQLPFAMLRLSEAAQTQYLIERFGISTLPSLSTLDAIRKQSAVRRAGSDRFVGEYLAIANPSFTWQAERTRKKVAGSAGPGRIIPDDALRPLPKTEVLASNIAHLFGPPAVFTEPGAAMTEVLDAYRSVVLVQGAAGERQVRRWLSSYDGTSWRNVLFATHGFANQENGMLSGLCLAAPEPGSEGNDFLFAHDFLDIRLNAQVVVLAACESGLGRRHAGEGLVGMCGALLAGGAETVCASVWPVNEESTLLLTREFLTNLELKRMSRVEALRQAQLRVLRQGKTSYGQRLSDPYYWAGLVLSGEYGPPIR